MYFQTIEDLQKKLSEITGLEFDHQFSMSLVSQSASSVSKLCVTDKKYIEENLKEGGNNDCTCTYQFAALKALVFVLNIATFFSFPYVGQNLML